MTEKRTKTVPEICNGAIDMTTLLEAGETLQGTPTMRSVPSGLIFSSPTVTPADSIIDNHPVAAGKGVTFIVSGGSAGKYFVGALCATSLGQTREGHGTLVVE